MKKINIHIRALLITSLVSCAPITNASENKNIDVIAVPGLLGNDSDNGYSEKIISLFKGSIIRKTGTLSIAQKPDLGQRRCVQHLDDKIYHKGIYNKSHTNNSIIIAASQGTATITRFITQYNYTPKAIIFEGYAASFNQCISHVVETQAPLTKYLPLKYYWLPYLAKMLPYALGTWFPLWHYNPAEKQPIELLKNMPKDVPIIIVHCRQDRLTPHEGALAAYQKLIDTGHKKSYLISVDVSLKNLDPNNFDSGHIDVLAHKGNTKHFNNLQTILLDHQLLPSKLLREQDLGSVEFSA